MASNINPTNINGAYPIAGQDNDSQGFRDNFTNIRTNLTHAKTELEDLQSKAILKSPLVGGGPIENSFNGVLMTGAQTKAFTESVLDQGTKTGNVTLDFTMGDHQKVVVVTGSGPLAVEFANWPAAGVYANIRVWFATPSNAAPGPMGPILFPVAVDAGRNTVLGFDTATGLLTPTRSGDYFLEFGTIDGGTTISVIALYTPESADEFVMNTSNNNLKGHVLSNFAQQAVTHALVSSAAEIDLSVADFHRIVTTGPLLLSFTNWPAAGYTKTRLWVNVTNPAHKITFPPMVGLDKITAGSASSTTLDTVVGDYLFEFSSMAGVLDNSVPTPKPVVLGIALITP